MSYPIAAWILFALALFVAGIVVGVLAPQAKQPLPPTGNRTTEAPGPRFSCVGSCFTGDCDCRRFDGMREGYPALPVHDGCTCILEAPGSYFAQAERAAVWANGCLHIDADAKPFIIVREGELVPATAEEYASRLQELEPGSAEREAMKSINFAAMYGTRGVGGPPIVTPRKEGS